MCDCGHENINIHIYNTDRYLAVVLARMDTFYLKAVARTVGVQGDADPAGYCRQSVE